jgi:hypothetical protein
MFNFVEDARLEVVLGPLAGVLLVLGLRLHGATPKY